MSDRSIDPTAAHAAVERGARLIDVRALEEFEDGRPARAENIPLARFVEGRLVDDAAFVARVRDAIAVDEPVLLLCRSGVRARRAAQLLSLAGYTDVRVVVGGYDGTRGPFGEVLEPGWRRSGLG